MTRIAPVTCALLLAVTAAMAQDVSVPIDPRVTEIGSDYERTIRWQRLQTDARYFDTEAPAPPAELRKSWLQRLLNLLRFPDINPRIVGLSAAVVILAFIAFLVLWFGNFNTLSFRSPESTIRRNIGDGEGPEDELEGPPGLADILANRDRAAAVHALLSAALVRVADELGLSLHPSWTARDILRRVPSDWAPRRALGDLMRVAEEVHFGGRPISEEEFDRVVHLVAPVFQLRNAV